MASFQKLFIGEKPSATTKVAEYFAKKLNLPIKTVDGLKTVGPYVFTSTAGHLLGLMDIEDYTGEKKPWAQQDLPFIPPKFQSKVGSRDPKDTARKKSYVNDIKKGLGMVSEVVHFGDPDDEGQLIVDSVLEHLKNKKPVTRLWCGALDYASLDAAMKNLKDNAQFRGLRNCASARSEADWLYGINLTMKASVAFSKAAMHASVGRTDMCSMGRVQSATLSLLADRQYLIENFKPVNHYMPVIRVAPTADGKDANNFAAKWVRHAFKEPLSDADGLLVDKATAQTIIAAAQPTVTVVSYSATPKSEGMPVTFNLSDIQSHMSSVNGMSAADTLANVQALYLKAYCSYPRTDWGHLPEEQHGSAPSIIKAIQKSSGTYSGDPLHGACANANPSLKSAAFNTKKVGAHHGIIPTADAADLSKLSPGERAVYLEIAKRYLLQFHPKAEYLHTEIKLKADKSEEIFSASGRQYTNLGWKGAFKGEATSIDNDNNSNNNGAEADATLPALTKGQVLTTLSTDLGAAVTKPPSPFTEGTLIDAMTNAHKYVRDPALANRLKGNLDLDGAELSGEKVNLQTGIGTQATRSGIIETLKQRGYITTQGKSLIPTARGFLVHSVLPEALQSPDKTADWQMQMDALRTGKGTQEGFIAGVAAALKQDLIDVGAKIARLNAVQLAPMVSGDSAKPSYGGGSAKPKANTHTRAKAKAGTKAAPPKGKGSYTCPKCGNALVKRVRKSDNNPFWGCSNFGGGCKAAFNDVGGKPKL